MRANTALGVRVCNSPATSRNTPFPDNPPQPLALRPWLDAHAPVNGPVHTGNTSWTHGFKKCVMLGKTGDLVVLVEFGEKSEEGIDLWSECVM